jgi:acetyl esterase/lipase
MLIGVSMITEKKYIKTKDGNLKLTILRPKKTNRLLPGILWFHGGGYESGGAYWVHFTIGKKLAKKFGGIVISPEYRTSKKNPYPAAFDDCTRTLEYVYNNAEKLGINKNKIIVGGESAGGGLAVAVCLYARDVAKIPIKLQIPLYPMLDCDDTESSKNNNGYNWNTKKNHRGWSRYLGELYKSGNVPKYASPSKEIDYSNLPPCYTYVLDGEPFLQETIDYIDNLQKSNVVAKLDIYHGSLHGFDMLFWTKKAKKAKNVLYNDVRMYFED